MTNILEILTNNIVDSIAAKEDLLQRKDQAAIFKDSVQKVIECYQQGGRLYIAGNGGSAADAQHLAAEFVSKLAKDREPLPAEALTVDSSILTAIGNDYGYDKIFSRQIAGKLTKKDIFLGITTSGNSANIVNALEECRKMKVPTIVFSGNDGGLVKQIADYCVIAPGKRTSTIQEVHIILAHTLCECVEREIFKF
jgi:D-sedoheptulose 7-phosphate isomerase